MTARDRGLLLNSGGASDAPQTNRQPEADTMLAMARLTVSLGSLDFLCEVDFHVLPGEPEVRYYADGSGYPGCPAEVDCIGSVEIIEVEYFDGKADFWEYKDRAELGDCAVLAERWIRDELAGGSYDDELLSQAE